jgi:hypothetical protein
MFNLFDSSAKKPQNTPKKGGAAPQPQSTAGGRQETAAEIFIKVKALNQEIKEKVAFLMEKGGLTTQAIRKWLYDPTHFTPKEWLLIQEHRDTIERDIGLNMAPTYKKIKSEKESKTQSRERKGKTLGNRKKWIDMR